VNAAPFKAQDKEDRRTPKELIADPDELTGFDRAKA
jgi:hypothetical protein